MDAMAEISSNITFNKSECIFDQKSKLDWKELNAKERKCGEVVLLANTDFLFICTFCDESFYSVIIFQSHIKDLHIPDSQNDPDNKDPLNLPKIEQDADPTTEDLSTKIGNSKQTFKKTKNIINIDIDVLTENCNNQVQVPDAGNQSDTDSNDCEQIFLTQAQDIEDLLVAQKKVKKKRNRQKKDYSCSFCQLSASDKRSLEKHLLSNHGTGTRHQCEECGKCFRSGSNLRAHLVIHSGTRPYKCDLCAAGFSHINSLKTHRYIHTGERPHKCNECDKGFLTSSACRAHMREHTGETPFVCHICERRFANKCSFNRHMINHSDRRDHVCDQCNMAFKQKETLTKHMVCHSNEKRFACDVCPNRFAHKKNLVQHKKLHLNVKQYVCKVCSKDFAQNAGLYSHMKYHKKKE